MISRLNQLFLNDSQRIICQRMNNRPSSCLTDLLIDIQRIQGQVRQVEHDTKSKKENWLLFSTDSYQYLVGLLALSSLNKRVILSANQQPEWLLKIVDEFDAMLTDQPLNLDKKPHISFEFLTTKLNKAITSQSYHEGEFETEFNGKESIRFFTSGSTGSAKAVNKTLSNLICEVDTLESTFSSVANRAMFIASVSHCHIYGLLFKVLWPLLTGRVWLNESIEYPEQLNEASSVSEDLLFVSSPAFLSRLDNTLAKINAKIVFSSGGPLSYHDALQSRVFFGELPTEVFGSTETGGIGYRKQHSAEQKWRLFDGIRLEQVHNGCRLYSPYLVGQSSIELDDNITLFQDRKFMLNGRKDRVVKLGEKRISLTEIENYLKSLPEIEECIAVILEGKREVIGCVLCLSKETEQNTCKESNNAMIRHWKEAMRNRFDAVTIPRKWRIVKSIPRNSQSKVDMLQLLKSFNQQQKVC